MDTPSSTPTSIKPKKYLVNWGNQCVGLTHCLPARVNDYKKYKYIIKINISCRFYNFSRVWSFCRWSPWCLIPCSIKGCRSSEISLEVDRPLSFDPSKDSSNPKYYMYNVHYNLYMYIYWSVLGPGRHLGQVTISTGLSQMTFQQKCHVTCWLHVTIQQKRHVTMAGHQMTF